MVINPTDSSTLSPAASSALGAPASTGAASAKDQFMRLFIAQLQHQDPLDPQKGADMVAQLSQMTAVEQSAETNQHLATLETGQSASSRSAMAGLVGRNIHAKASSLTLPSNGQPVPFEVHLDGPATKVEVTIADQNGQPVRTITLGAGMGNMPVQWDGRGQNGELLAPGAYKISVKATGPSGGDVSASPEISGMVDGIDYRNGNTQFLVGGALVSPSDVISISK